MTEQHDPRVLALRQAAGMCITVKRNAERRWMAKPVSTENEATMYAFDRGVQSASEEIRLRLLAMAALPPIPPEDDEQSSRSDTKGP